MSDNTSTPRDQPVDRPFGPDAAAILATEHRACSGRGH